MLESGEIDALISAHVPPSARRNPARVRRLFPDYEKVERDYFRRTGIFPIMHTIMIRREIYEPNRWIARALMQAFEDAKALAMKAYSAADIFFNAPTMVPWFV
jgi:4,5-dihydroxyphthalate decarboxylase